MATKGYIAEEAYDSLGIGGNLESDMIMRGVKNLERLMGSWENEGVVIGYNLSASDPAPEDESGISDSNLQAVVLGLACQLSQVLRMPVDMSMKSAAERAYKMLVPIDVPSVATNPNMPLGQGANGYYWGETYQQFGVDELTTESNQVLTVEPNS